MSVEELFRFVPVTLFFCGAMMLMLASFRPVFRFVERQCDLMARIDRAREYLRRRALRRVAK